MNHATVGSQISYDPSVDVLYVTLPAPDSGRVLDVTYEPVVDKLLVDIDADDKVIGIELLDLDLDGWIDVVAQRHSLTGEDLAVLGLARVFVDALRASDARPNVTDDPEARSGSAVDGVLGDTISAI